MIADSVIQPVSQFLKLKCLNLAGSSFQSFRVSELEISGRILRFNCLVVVLYCACKYFVGWQVFEIKLSCRKFKTALLYKVGTEAGGMDYSDNTKMVKTVRMKITKLCRKSTIVNQIIKTVAVKMTIELRCRKLKWATVPVQSWQMVIIPLPTLSSTAHCPFSQESYILTTMVSIYALAAIVIQRQ